MFDWLNSVAEYWAVGVLLLAVLPPIAAFAHMIYFIYLVPDDNNNDGDDTVVAVANDEGVGGGATTANAGITPQPGKKHKSKRA